MQVKRKKIPVAEKSQGSKELNVSVLARCVRNESVARKKHTCASKQYHFL
jgi:hypothetical protein